MVNVLTTSPIPKTIQPNATRLQKVLVTGASGYLGRSLCEVMAQDFELVRMDVKESEGPGTFVLGSVADRDLVNRACDGIDALVLAHMAPNRTNAYDWPDLGMDINVKGAALAFEAAVRHGIRRVVLISSVSVIQGHMKKGDYISRDLSSKPTVLYALTKTLQEEVARYYHRAHGIGVAMLRPGYILREDSLVNKYGESRPMVTWQCVDPRDIGLAATNALQLPDLQCELFYLMAGPGVENHVEMRPSFERLGWDPKYRFAGIPVEQI